MNKLTHLGCSLLMMVACGACASSAPQSQAPVVAPGQVASEAELKEAERAIEARQYDKALQRLSSLLSRQPNHAKATFYEGVANEHLGRRDQAERAYRRALELDPAMTDAAVNLSALLIEAQRFQEATVVLQKALTSAPDDPLLHTNMGYALQGQGQLALAVQHYRAALEKTDSAETRLALAQALSSLQRSQEAVKELRLVASDPALDPAMLATLGQELGRLGAYAECIAVMDRAIEQRRAAPLHAQRGLCRHGLGDEQGAKADYLRAVTVDPSYAPGYYLLGRQFLVEGNTQQAIEAFEACAGIAPDSRCKHAAEQARQGKVQPADND